jgi:hypothetical protein
MRRRFLIGLAGLLTVIGCQSTGNGGLMSRKKERADDPFYTPAEQQRKARYLHTYPDPDLAPRTGAERVGGPSDSPHGQ